MKQGKLVALVMGLCFSLPAWSQTAPPMSPAKMKCEDFVAVAAEYQPSLVYWAAGVDKLGVKETDTMVVDTAQPIAVIVGECKKTPKASFKTKVHDLSKSGQITLFEHR
ncbi:HdeA/HdeB family chaperone [Paraburkholderia hospita]|uniref:HdeA/HdeB family chaperone n=1 Tax=Paraburkholderia hospita TaxID=169430 RepID=UPI000B34852E|nr:HdeA/HdeB family chaperone [Paraburkholderia hospita]OUL71010.1 HdeA [Paraburkholderia hospita]